MMKILSALDEEDLTYEVSDDALEIAGGNENCRELHTRGLYRPVCLPRLISPTDQSKDWRHPCQTAS